MNATGSLFTTWWRNGLGESPGRISLWENLLLFLLSIIYSIECIMQNVSYAMFFIECILLLYFLHSISHFMHYALYRIYLICYIQYVIIDPLSDTILTMSIILYTITSPIAIVPSSLAIWYNCIMFYNVSYKMSVKNFTRLLRKLVKKFTRLITES